jgi:RNA polymerase sigma-70 factor (ECF subfamily)
MQGIALPMTGLSESLRRAQSGERAAFEQIMQSSERRVLRIALRLLNNPQDAQDAAQEVFLRLYQHLKRLDPERELEPWLYRVTVNVCRDMGRARQYAVGLEDAPEAAAPEPGAQHGMESAERREMMRHALHCLGEKERAAVVLRDVEGLSTREVAEILGSSETTVRSQISTARLKLRDFTNRLMRRRS